MPKCTRNRIARLDVLQLKLCCFILPLLEMTDQQQPGGLREIERKFSVPDNIEECLVNIGATCVSTKEFTDVYHDTETFTLALGDHWLRTRGKDCWELKYRQKGDLESGDPTVTTYREVAGEADILTIIRNLLQEKLIAPGITSLQELVDSATVRPFATIKTTRKSYSTPGSAVIDLDETDWGFRVGEIEILVNEHQSELLKEEALKAATLELQRLANLLGELTFLEIDCAICASMPHCSSLKDDL